MNKELEEAISEIEEGWSALDSGHPDGYAYFLNKLSSNYSPLLNFAKQHLKQSQPPSPGELSEAIELADIITVGTASMRLALDRVIRAAQTLQQLSTLTGFPPEQLVEMVTNLTTVAKTLSEALQIVNSQILSSEPWRRKCDAHTTGEEALQLAKENKLI